MIKKQKDSKINSRDIYKYIDEKKFKKIIKKFCYSYIPELKDKENTFFRNKIDPMLSIFSMFLNDFNYDSWVSAEKTRQLQKSLENYNGNFQQDLLRSMNGWSKMEILDAVNKEKKMIVDVKNKQYTEKGDKKVASYDSIKSCLAKKEYKGFTGYFLVMIKNVKSDLDIPFEPPDNKTKTRRPKREDIRIIDGVTFYGKITGDKKFLYKVYQEIPIVLSEILKKEDLKKEIIEDERFESFYKKTFN
ncbi:Eco47II family restriction endonuclease [Candidatus Pelagibacter sp. HIMB1509]|uniref:Eco47II family restriction endonuclease n=1 Tax=Candidatus Pelagibacter sp. HIMB1509 TaxID=3413339 RepID=UPI003F8383AC